MKLVLLSGSLALQLQRRKISPKVGTTRLFEENLNGATSLLAGASEPEMGVAVPANSVKHSAMTNK